MKVNYAEINFPTTKPHHCNECGDPVSEGSILINGFCLDCIYFQMIDMELAEENPIGEQISDTDCQHEDTEPTPWGTCCNDCFEIIEP